MMFGLFKKKFNLEKQESHIDTTILDSSLDLLRSTTFEVSAAATAAAEALEERLKDTEDRLFGIIDSIDDFICVKDSNGRWKILNKYGQNLYGWNNNEWFNKTDYELAEEYPCHKEGLYSCILSDIEAWEQGMPFRSEEMFINGQKRYYFDVVKTPTYDENGNRKELIIIGRNITDIKEKNKRVKAAFNALNAASDVIVICDGHGYITFCNDKFLYKYGFTDYHDVIGKKLNIIGSEKTDKKVYEELWSTIKSNKLWSGEITNKTLRGQEILCKVNIMPVMNGLPEPIYYICTMKLINEKDKQ